MNDYAPTGIQGATLVEFGTDVARNITGIVAPDPAGTKLLIMYNGGSFNAVFTHADAASAAGNRIIGFASGNVTLTPRTAVMFIYFSTYWVAMLRGS